MNLSWKNRTILAAGMGLCLLLGTDAVLADRIILKDNDYAVSRVDESCSEMLRLRIDTGRPAIFRDASPEMASLITTARAIAGFECPGVTSLRLDGFHKETGEQLFEARTGDRNDWALSVRYRAESVNSDRDRDTQANYQVAQLYIDMPLEDAHKRLADEFGREAVRYDDWDRTLLAGNKECPLGKPGRSRILPPGARCIRAKFSVGEAPTLQSMRLLQSVSGDQLSAGISALQDRYGRPDFNERRDPGRRQREAGVTNVMRLGWGETVRNAKGQAGEDRKKDKGRHGKGPRHQLEADLSSSGERTWLHMRLTRPDPKADSDVTERDSVFGF